MYAIRVCCSAIVAACPLAHLLLPSHCHQRIWCMRNIFAVILIIFGLVACKPEKPSDGHQHQIDSLLTELKYMNDSLNSLRIQRVQQLHDSLRKHHDTTRVANLAETRRQSLTDSTEAGNQRLKEAGDVLNWYDNIYREITFSRSHLRTLQQQMQQSRLDSATIREIKKEKEIVGGLKERFDQEYRGLKKAIRQLLNK